MNLKKLAALSLLWLVVGIRAEIPGGSIYTVEIDLTGETTKHLEYDTLKEHFSALGIKAIPTGSEEQNYDFSISVNVHEFNEPEKEVFCTYGYDIYYRDTLESVDLSIDFDLHIDETTTKMAMEILNSRLIYILNNYPNKPVLTIQEAARPES